MPITKLNSIDVFHATAGEGEPLVLVHGGWSDHTTWGLVAPQLAERFRVITYDRRGHSRSERPAGVAPRRTHEEDLAAVIETLAGGPAHVVGNSYGGFIALSLAGRRPDLFRTVAAHEPPVASAASGEELERLTAEAVEQIHAVRRELSEHDDPEPAVRRFMEHVALGPGGWELLPEPIKQICLGNAPAYVADLSDPDWARFDLAALRRLPRPALLSKGDASPRWMMLLADRLARATGDAAATTLPGAGHAPHLTHAAEYAAMLAAFCERAPLARAA